MEIDLALTLGGLFVGFVVGLTGMGGGALMTPMLVLFFGIPPLAAVSSDLVVSALMKPVGGLVHFRSGTVDMRMVRLLCVGSIPSAFAGVLLLRALGGDEGVQEVVKISLGVALIVAAGALVAKAYISLRARTRRRALGLRDAPEHTGPVVLRPVPTILVGAVGGLIVGMTSVGSGSLIIIALLGLYPMLSANRLVGTDLVQAVPLVASAALAHLIFGDFHFDLAAGLLIGALPGVYLGAKASAYAPAGIVRRALALVLLASGLKLVGVGTIALAWVILAVVLAGPVAWALLRRRHGLPLLAHTQMVEQRRRRLEESDEVAAAKSPR